MGIVYHGSPEHDIKRLEPQKSTHGIYVYATKDKTLALNFSGRCGDDLTYDIGHFDSDRNGPWEIVENIPGAFNKMFSNSSSIYTLSDETFKDIDTRFEEVVSEVDVDVLNEEDCENVYNELLEAEKKGLVKIYRYPNKPSSMKQDGSDILDKWEHYKTDLNKDFSKNEFDRLVYLHPELLDKINELSKKMGYDYYYKPDDLVDLFKQRVARQLYDIDHEQYVECSYISICNSFPELKEKIDSIYDYYNKEITRLKDEKSTSGKQL